MFHYNPDNKILQLLSLYFDLTVLTALWMITSLPIITIGVSTTALYSVLFKMMTEDGAANIVRSFFGCWRSELRRSTAICALLSGFLVLVGADLFICVAYRPTGPAGPFLWTGAILAALAALCLIAYVFPINARFNCTVRQVFMNALRFAGGNPLPTLGLVVLLVLIGAAMFFLMALSLFLVGPLLYIAAKQLNRIFQPIVLQFEEKGLPDERDREE